jgi:hypothetical protein
MQPKFDKNQKNVKILYLGYNGMVKKTISCCRPFNPIFMFVGTARHMVATSLSMDRLIDDTLKVIATLQGKASRDSTTKVINTVKKGWPCSRPQPG